MPTRFRSAAYSSSSSTLTGSKIFSLENLPAVETLHVFDAFAPGNDLGSIVIASGLHTNALMDLFYLGGCRCQVPVLEAVPRGSPVSCSGRVAIR